MDVPRQIHGEGQRYGGEDFHPFCIDQRAYGQFICLQVQPIYSFHSVYVLLWLKQHPGINGLSVICMLVGDVHVAISAPPFWHPRRRTFYMVPILAFFMRASINTSQNPALPFAIKCWEEVEILVGWLALVNFSEAVAVSLAEARLVSHDGQNRYHWLHKVLHMPVREGWAVATSGWASLYSNIYRANIRPRVIASGVVVHLHQLQQRFIIDTRRTRGRRHPPG
mmetsp:Transcript_88489/g.189942  ORF Transcript_88489/g.189942 Transcript_88489/m.189942 type:complete len:224 (+) Transcript_88489:395-1066(+)